LDNSTAAWISCGSAIGGGLVAGLLSGAYQHWRDWQERPRLALDFEATDGPNLVRINGKDGQVDRYVRVRIRNVGKHVAKESIVYLTSIEEVHDSGTTPTAFQEAMQLSWPLNEYGHRNLPNSGDLYVDLVKIHSRAPGWHFGFKQLHANHDGLKSHSGTYRFHLVATAENAESKTLVVNVKYEQAVNTLRAYQAI